MPRRIQLSRKRGFRLPAGAVNCARPGPWGNPFRVGRDSTAEQCVLAHRELLVEGRVTQCHAVPYAEQLAYRAWAVAHLPELRGRDLACWCRLGTPCHADTLLRLAESARG